MRRLVILALALSMFLAATAAWFWRDMQSTLDAPMDLPGTEVLHVAPGTSVRALGTELGRRGWLRQPLYLELEARQSGRAGSIKAGDYAIAPGTTPRDLLALLVAGQVIQHQMTIIEGWTFRELIAAVRANPRLQSTLPESDDRHLMAELGYPGHEPEGRFLPDTYRFPSGTTDVDFLRRAYRAMELVLDEAWRGRAEGLPFASAYQALILASIVEKETAVAEERARIAGVFVRRLQKGMRLQTDPTVIYALGASFDGNIRRADLDVDSPYNTYRVSGLPPTPIALPGAAAIHATLHPEPGDALYFVSRGDGSHQFSATLEEHNRAVRQYQLGKGK